MDGFSCRVSSKGRKPQTARPPNSENDLKRSDVVVHGATPAGIAAAISVARRDSKTSVALVTPYKRVGGLITNGLTHPDFRTFEGRTGCFASSIDESCSITGNALETILSR